MAWMRQLLDWQREAADPGEFLESLRYDLAAQEIFVFTPKGDVITLPSGLHPGRPGLRRAHRGRPPLHRVPGQRQARRAGAQAESGDVVEIFTSKAEAPGPSRRLARVRRVPAGQDQDQAVVRQGAARGGHRGGQGGDHREARRTSMPLQRLVSADAMAALARELHFPDLSGAVRGGR